MTKFTMYRIGYKFICIAICLLFVLCGCTSNINTDTSVDNIISSDTLPDDTAVDVNSSDIPEENNNVAVKQPPDIDNTRAPQNFSIKDSGLITFTFDDISGKYLLFSYEAELVSYDPLYPRIDGAAQISPIIVVGDVIDLYYTDQIQGYWTPGFTIYDIQITHVLRGDFVTGDIISIEEQGGYVSGPQVHYVRGGPREDGGYVKVNLCFGAPEPEIGDKYILFLEESNEVPNAYSLMGAYTGKYIVDENNMASRFLKDDEFWTYGTLDEVIAAVSENPFNEERYLNLDKNT